VQRNQLNTEWNRDYRAFLHGRWVITRLAALVMETAAKPVRVALYGNGRHTEWLLALLRQLPLPISVTMIMDDKAGRSTPVSLQATVPVCRPDHKLAHGFDVIIPSSDSVEYQMSKRCCEVFGHAVPVYFLYEGLPFPPGPYAKVDPALPRISLIIVPTENDPAVSVTWQALVQAQYYPNLESVTSAAACRPVPANGLLPLSREIAIPNSAGYVAAVRAALAEVTGEWICLANSEDSLESGALRVLAQQTADTEVILGATRLTRNGTCVDVITPRSTLPDALLDWWHHDVMPSSANAMFIRRAAILEAMALLPGDLSPAAVRYELLLRLAKRHGAVAITQEALASSETAVHPLEQTQAVSIAQRHDGILDPVARIRHRQLDLLLSGTSDDFVAAQKMLPCPVGEDLPPISIITPSFNARPYLARACYSVVMQCYQNVEHVVIDGASTDGTQSLFSQFPIRALSEPDHGMYEAINKGIRLASHRYIIVLSSDDFLEPGALQAIGMFLRGHPDTPFVAGGLRVITTDRRVYFNSAASDRLSNLLRWWRPNAYPYNTVAYVFTREHWAAVGGFDATLRVAADADFVMKSRHHAHFARLPDIFGTWDMRPDCLTMQTRTCLGRDELKAVVGRHVDALGLFERKQFLAEQEAVLCAF